ncbi:unnamed protein product [Caenorhabditis auriculariae]|uniref:Uncharacterized protein n=1 Tax=Caenorhabditis auriculariae TaxID=2777116 RepID=A0A8S1GQB5_9PELO|nr:unnamed protein product [Caenorhabditis auriculariae]
MENRHWRPAPTPSPQPLFDKKSPDAASIEIALEPRKFFGSPISGDIPTPPVTIEIPKIPLPKDEPTSVRSFISRHLRCNNIEDSKEWDMK